MKGNGKPIDYSADNAINYRAHAHDYVAELSIDGPGGKGTVKRRHGDSGFAEARYPADFGGKLVSGTYRWTASVGGVEIVRGAFEVSADGKSIRESGESIWSKTPPEGTWQTASHAGD